MQKYIGIYPLLKDTFEVMILPLYGGPHIYFKSTRKKILRAKLQNQVALRRINNNN